MTQSTTNHDAGVIRWEDLRKDYLPVCYNTMRKMVADGKFPAPIKLSPRRIAWRKADVLAWINAAK